MRPLESRPPAARILTFRKFKRICRLHLNRVPFQGAISRRISPRGQFFPQFLRSQLEELPEAQVGPLQAQQAVRCLICAAAGPEAAQVPVQAFQVQEPLRYLPRPRLPHPRHTVHALHQAARSPDPAEHRADPPRVLTPLRTRRRQWDRADQGPGSGGGGQTPGLTTETFEVQPRRPGVGVPPQLGQPRVDLVQEREALPAEPQPPGLGPRRSAPVRPPGRDGRLGLGPVGEAALGGEDRERRLARAAGPRPG